MELLDLANNTDIDEKGEDSPVSFEEVALRFMSEENRYGFKLELVLGIFPEQFETEVTQFETGACYGMFSEQCSWITLK